MTQAQHPQALTVSLLIAAGKWRGKDDVGEAAADTIEVYFSDWPEEKRADLYALIAESVKANDTVATITQKVSDALWKNQKHFP